MSCNNPISPAVLSTLCLVLPLSAVQAATPLNTINVTANRMARTVDETLAAVTVLTREDIEKSQARDITQLLDGTQGLSMSNNGGLGKTASIRLRGTNSNQVLVLIDGVRIGSATLGTVSFQDIPLAQIERIEIVRGRAPNSTGPMPWVASYRSLPKECSPAPGLMLTRSMARTIPGAWRWG